MLSFLGPKGEKLDGLDDDQVLLPLSRLISDEDTAPSYVYDEIAKAGPSPGTLMRVEHSIEHNHFAL